MIIKYCNFNGRIGLIESQEITSLSRFRETDVDANTEKTIKEATFGNTDGKVRRRCRNARDLRKRKK